MSNSLTAEIVKRLSIGLNTVDIDHVIDLVDRFGLYGAARIMGYDISHYNNLLMSGRLAIENLKINSPKTLMEYADIMKGRLNIETYNFIAKNHEALQDAIGQNEERDYDHDWFSANTMITMYSANRAHGEDGIETPQYTWMRIAIQLYCDSTNAIHDVIRAYNEMSIGWYTPASPTIFNAGMKDPQMSSCYLLTVDDSLESIMKGLENGGMISKSSGGLGYDISRIRHSEIKETGMSSGIIPMLQLYNSMVRYVNQAGRRKGAATMFLRPHHIDVEDFIELPRKVGDRYARAHDLNICLWTSQIFWDRIRSDGMWTLFCPARAPQLNDISGAEFTKAYIAAENDQTIAPRHKKVIRARELYDKILNVQKEAGMPYLMNADAANIKSNHRHLGYIKSSNLCVAGETPILTSTGYYPIQSLQNQEVQIWNGCEWSTVIVKQTAARRHLITVCFSNGRSLTCTPDHKFIVGKGPLKEATRISAQMLSPGTKLRQEAFPVINGTEPFAHPYIHGALCAFGCFTEKGPILDIMGDGLTDIINHPDMIIPDSGTKTFPENMPAPYKVPINSSINIKLQWLSGFISARSFSTELGITLINVNEQMLQNIQLLLTTLGCFSHLEHGAPVNVQVDVDKNMAISNHGLLISWGDFSVLHNMGLVAKYEIPEVINSPMGLVVTEILDVGRLSPTYCFTEEKNNAGVFNGILTGQCLEVIEFTDDETIAVCNLHSLSLRMFGKTAFDRNNTNVDSALRDAIDFQQLSNISRRVVENLNKVIDHNWYPLDKIGENGDAIPGIIHKSNKRHRPVGMGVSGFAELLHILDLPFEDAAVHTLNKMVFACMYWNAIAQSVQLAVLNGSYGSFQGSPFSEGKLQFDLWKEEFDILGPNIARKAEDDEPLDPSVWGQSPVHLYKDGQIIDTILPTWVDLKRCIIKYGINNSLLLANMPTASTAQLRRNCESVEAHQNNMYSRKVLKCSYPVLNRYLIGDLEPLGSWNDATVEYIRVKNGSILGLTKYINDNLNLFPKFNGNLDRIAFIEKKYKTMWEIPQKVFMKLEAERGRYIDQSSSANRYIRDCTDDKLRACHIYANMLGLKTIMYYLRQTGGETIKFTADPNMIQHIKGVVVEVAKDQITTNIIDTTRTTICTDDVCVSCT